MSNAPAPSPISRSSSMVENIQGLRGIAALLVVCAHVRFPLATLNPDVAKSWPFRSDQGAIGVDLFFIISGYVICMTASKKHHDALDFFLARIARISPLYLMAFPIAFYHQAQASWPHIPWNSAWNGLFYLPIFDVGIYSLPPLTVGWTLSFEMWFYVAFALMLLVWKPQRVALFLPLFFLIGAPLMTLLYHGAWFLPRFLFFPYVLEFAMGCLIFNYQKWITGWLPWAFLVAGVIFAIVFTLHTGYLGFYAEQLDSRLDRAWLRVLLWGTPCALIAAGAVGVERSHGYVMPKALIWLGGISYSLYLTHLSSFAMLAAIGKRLHLQNPIFLVPTLAVFAIIMGWLCWKYVENPLTKRAQSWAKKRAQQAKVARENVVSA